MTVGELKKILSVYDDDYSVLLELKHDYDIPEEVGKKGWIAYINAIGVDDVYKELRIMN